MTLLDKKFKSRYMDVVFSDLKGLPNLFLVHKNAKKKKKKNSNFDVKYRLI